MSRDVFLAVLPTGPLLKSDAIVVLSGDGTSRADVALQLLQQGGAQTIVVTGSYDNPPFSLVAKRLESYLLGKGVAPRCITRLELGGNTREEAIGVVAHAIEQGWKRLLVVSSGFHCFRVYLTFVQVLVEAKMDRDIHVCIVPASQAKWSDTPKGSTKPRLDLLADELDRIAKYQEAGHVASYEDGISYLLHWEKAA